MTSKRDVDFSNLPKIAPPINQVEPTRDYPPSFEGLRSWSEQLEILHEVLKRKLNPDQVKERAERYLGAKKIWELNFSFLGADKPIFDGLLVFANPFAAAQKLGLGDLAEDLSKATEGRGRWGALCEQMLFPHLAKQEGGFKNWRKGAMGSDRFLPLVEVAEWLYQCSQSEGDFIVRPCSAGRCMAGYAVESSRVAVERHQGIVAPSWAGGQLLITHPHMITAQSLCQDMAGDCYRFGDDRAFRSAPCFLRGDARLGFDAFGVGGAGGRCGAVFVLRE